MKAQKLKLSPKKLKTLFIDEIQKSCKFVFVDGVQPFLMSYSNKQYYVYIKHLSSAYFKDRPDTTRAQLPVRPDFDEIKKSAIPFIFLGYDVSNDVYVCWNYHIAKSRLNEKESVSFYSRLSFQNEVKKGKLLRKKLKNDDEPILFKREDLILFFENIEKLFADEENLELPYGLSEIEEKTNHKNDGKIYKITEKKLLNKLQKVLNSKANNILEAISIAKNFYGDKYPNMKYSDWSNLVKSAKLNY